MFTPLWDIRVELNAYGPREKLERHVHLLQPVHPLWCKLLTLNDYISSQILPPPIFSKRQQVYYYSCLEKKKQPLSRVDFKQAS